MWFMHNGAEQTAGMWLMHNGAQLTTGMWSMHNGAQLTTGMWFMHNGDQLTTGMWSMHNGAQLTTGMWFTHNGAQQTTGMWFMRNGAQQTPVLSTRQLQTGLLAWPQRPVDLNAVDIQIAGTGRGVCTSQWCTSRRSALAGLHMNAEQLRTSSCDRRCAKAERSHLSPTPQNFSEPNTLHWCVTCTKYIKLRAQWTGVPVSPSIYLYPQLLNKFR